jgi:hypothetical protein
MPSCAACIRRNGHAPLQKYTKKFERPKLFPFFFAAYTLAHDLRAPVFAKSRPCVYFFLLRAPARYAQECILLTPAYTQGVL